MGGRPPDDEHGTYDPGSFAEELAAAVRNHDIGTNLWFENDHIRVFESRLEPGERAPFHVHDRTYFWTVVDSGRGLQRFPNGTSTTHEYALGETAARSLPLVRALHMPGDGWMPPSS